MSNDVRNEITLTGAQIKQLAEFAGMSVDCESDTLDATYVVREGDCIAVRNMDEPNDPASVSYYSHIAYSEEYPEDGCIGLGDELAPPEAKTP